MVIKFYFKIVSFLDVFAFSNIATFCWNQLLIADMFIFFLAVHAEYLSSYCKINFFVRHTILVIETLTFINLLACYVYGTSGHRILSLQI